MAEVQRLRLDGVDLDLEGAEYAGANITAQDRSNFKLLVDELATTSMTVKTTDIIVPNMIWPSMWDSLVSLSYTFGWVRKLASSL